MPYAYTMNYATAYGILPHNWLYAYYSMNIILYFWYCIHVQVRT